jgi:hypothetical protein
VGGKAAVFDKDTGEVIDEVDESGKLVMSAYQAHLEAACDARDRAVEEDSPSAFQECLSQGFACLEAFLNEKANMWNKHNPENRLEDFEHKKVSLETKIKRWIPAMSGGAEIDTSVQQWSDFKKLKRLRDEHAIHPKIGGYGVAYADLANHLNAFRYGVALLLGNMHLKLGTPLPAVVINAHYMSDVKVVEVQGD